MERTDKLVKTIGSWKVLKKRNSNRDQYDVLCLNCGKEFVMSRSGLRRKTEPKNCIHCEEKK